MFYGCQGPLSIFSHIQHDFMILRNIHTSRRQIFTYCFLKVFAVFFLIFNNRNIHRHRSKKIEVHYAIKELIDIIDI